MPQQFSPLSGVTEGMDFVNGLFDQQASRQAGGLIASGDLEGAAGIIGNRGDIGGALKLQSESERRRLNQQAERAREIKERASWLGVAADTLAQIPDLEQRKQRFGEFIAPTMKAMGAPDEVIAQIGQAQFSDEDLATFKRLLGDEVRKFEKVGDSIVEINEATGGVTERYRAPQDNKVVGNALVTPEGKPLYTAPEYRTVGEGGAVVEITPESGGTGAGGPMAAADFGEIETAVLSAVPGAQVTSRTRTPERNAAVGGAPNSQHLAGTARDFVPPQGMSMAAFEAQVKASVPAGVEVINEGDHIHIERAPQRQGGGGSRVVAQVAPKRDERWRPSTREEKLAAGIDPDAPAQTSPQGKVEATSGQEAKITEGQRIAASLTYRALQGNERMNDLARRGVYKPDTVTSQLFKESNGVMRIAARTDKDRAFIQASKEFLAPILRRDSGAAVTDGELAVYMDIFIPRFEDSPEVMWQKAQARTSALRGLYGSASHAYDREYGAPGKWQVLTDSRGRPQGGGAAPTRGGARAPAAKPDFVFDPATGRMKR